MTAKSLVKSTLLRSVALAAAMFAGHAFADGENVVKIIGYYGEETEYDSLGGAVGSLQDLDTIVFLDDYTMQSSDEGLIGGDGWWNWLDLNGHTLSIPQEITGDEAFFGVGAGSLLYITNGTIVVGSDIEKKTGAGGWGICTKGQLDLQSGTCIVRNGGEASCLDAYAGATVNVDPGVVIDAACDAIRVQADEQGSILHGGNVTVNIKGGSLTSGADGAGNYCMFNITANEVEFKVNIYGGEINCAGPFFFNEGHYKATSCYIKTLDDQCKASFSSSNGLHYVIKDGYEAVPGPSGRYVIRSTSGGQDEPSWDDAVSSPEDSKAGDVWLSLPAALGNANARKLATWAKGMNIEIGNAATIDPEAFLLNCSNTVDAVAAAKAAFKIPYIRLVDGEVIIGYPVGDYNGTVGIFGTTAVDGIYEDTKHIYTGKNFFKAVLDF